MIPAVDEAILGSLKSGLSGIMPEDDIVLGGPETGGKKAKVYLNNDDFVIEEICMGSMAETMYEEVEETFDGDGKAVEFKLAKSPVRQIQFVEYPKGTVRFAPDDYGSDNDKGIVVFRDTPPKGKGNIRVRYTLTNPVGEMSFLRFVLTYGISIVSEDREDRDRITLACIEALYKDMSGLSSKGIEEIKLVKGFSRPMDGNKSTPANVLVYSVLTSMKIERAMTPMGKIDIKSGTIKK
jgi:hypothetical protein